MSKKKSAKSKEKKQEKPVEQKQQPKQGWLFLALLIFTVAFNGAAVMVLELLGTRVLAPIFGMSLYIWTALIAVTLLSLSIGYPIGGIIADRFAERREMLYLTMAIASLWLFLLLLLKNPILEEFSDMGPRSGPVVVSLLLFAVPLALLAMTPPLAVKYMAAEMAKVGITVGKVSAISTLGSLIGTVFTGFYLIPEIGVWKTLWTLAIALSLLAILGFLATRMAKAIAPTIILALCFFIIYPNAHHALPVESKMKLVAMRTSPYADIKVVDAPFKKWKVRFFFIGHGMHTIQFRTKNGNHALSLPIEQRFPLYWDGLKFLSLMREKPKDCLLIGLGGGVIYHYLKSQGIENVDVVEIDPAVVETARDYFDCKIPKQKLYTKDARQYVKQCKKKYDLIIMDAFGAGTAPYHLFSTGAFREYKKLLREDGILFSNYIGSIDGELSDCLAGITHTIKEVFPYNTMIIPAPKEFNFVFFSSNKPLQAKEQKLAKLSANNRKYLLKVLQNHAILLKLKIPKKLNMDNVKNYLNIIHLIPQDKGKAISDEQNFLEVLNIKQNEHLRKLIFHQFKDVFLNIP